MCARPAAGAVWLYGVFADVTEWHRPKRACAACADLVDSAEDAIISHSADGLIVDWNRGAERLYGYTKDEVRKKPVLRLFTPDGAKAYAEAVRRVRCGEPTGSYQAAQVRKGGERIEVSIRVSAIGARMAASPSSPGPSAATPNRSARTGPRPTWAQRPIC